MLTSGTANTRKATSSNLTANAKAFAGTSATFHADVRSREPMMVTPSPVVIERARSIYGRNSQDGSPGYSPSEASPLQQALNRHAGDTSPKAADAGPTPQPTPTSQFPIDGLKPTRVIEKI